MESQEHELGEMAAPEEQVAGCADDSTASATAHAGAASEDVNLSKLLSRFRNEAMYELRKLKLQQHPVSEFQNKDNLEQLLTQRAPQPSAGSAPPDGADDGEQATVAARARDFASRSSQAAAPRSQMPESVQLEVRCLIQQRPVRNVLQSPAVQERMEQALRDGLERRRRRQQGRRPRPQHHGGAEGDGRGNLLSAIRNRRPARPHLASASPSLQRRARRASQHPPEGGQYPLPRRDQNRILEQVRQSPALRSLDPDARNRIVTEVSHLVQQQLVTTALSGEFRGVLELHIQERAERLGQGMTAEEVIQSRQQWSRPGSSFSHRSTDEAAEPLANGSLSQLQQEVLGLKSQMLELKQMMRVSFDLQLDIQRSIRQEVAAAFAALCSPATLSVPGTAQDTSGASATHQAPPSVRPQGGDGGSNPHVVDSGNCVICSEAGIDCVIYRCGHMCVCVSCGLELKAQGLKCPICRAPITDIVRAYASML